MKLALTLALVGSAAAFAPQASVSGSSVSYIIVIVISLFFFMTNALIIKEHQKIATKINNNPLTPFLCRSSLPQTHDKTFHHDKNE